MKNNTLSNFQINDYLKNVLNFRGCFYKNELPDKLFNGFYIINLDNGSHGGTHWTVLYIGNYVSYNLPSYKRDVKRKVVGNVVKEERKVVGNVVSYFDSMGFPAPQEVEEKISKVVGNVVSYVYNEKQIQDIDSSSCGFYCIAFVNYMYRKKDPLKSFQSFIKLFNTKDVHANEKKLFLILRTLYHIYKTD